MTGKPGTPFELPTSDSVSCSVCLSEVPFTEAFVPEAADYVVHFCSLDCYERMRTESQNKGRNAGMT